MRKLTKLDISILICNAIENFDVVLYTFLAPILGKILFGLEKPIHQLMGAYGVLAISVFPKPLGAYLFTKLTIKKTPFFSLKLSIYGISLANLMIFFMPTYSEAGWIAIFMLILARCVISLFAAGEKAIARTLLVDRDTSYRMSAYYESSTMIGIIVASITSTFIIKLNDDISWRFAFLFSAILGMFSYFLRAEKQDKSNEVNFNITKSDIPTRKVMKIVFNRLMSNMTYYIPFVIMNNLIPMINPQISFETMMEHNSVLLVFDMLIFLAISYYKIKIAPQKMILLSYSFIAIFVPIMFLFLQNADMLTIITIRCFIVVFGVSAAVAQNVLFNQMFTKSTERYFFIGNSIAVTDALLGETIPTICLLLFTLTNSIESIALYMSICCLICIYFNNLE